MSAGLVFPIGTGVGGSAIDLDALQRFLVEEGNGLFELVTVYPVHAEAVPEQLQGDTVPGYAELDEASRERASKFGAALAETFNSGNVDSLRSILNESRNTRCANVGLLVSDPDFVPPEVESEPARDRLFERVAEPVLPTDQRIDIVRCMYALMLAARGHVWVSLAALLPELDAVEGSDGTTSLGTPSSLSADWLDRLSGHLGDPDQNGYAFWNSTLSLLARRLQLPVLTEETPEFSPPAGSGVVALIRGDAECEHGCLLVLSNVTNEPAEAAIDQRDIPVPVPTVMTDELTGDSVFVPNSGDHILSLELEAYETMWLTLG